MGNYANIILSYTNEAIGTIYFIEHGISLSEEVINSYLKDNFNNIFKKVINKASNNKISGHNYNDSFLLIVCRLY